MAKFIALFLGLICCSGIIYGLFGNQFQTNHSRQITDLEHRLDILESHQEGKSDLVAEKIKIMEDRLNKIQKTSGVRTQINGVTKPIELSRPKNLTERVAELRDQVDLTKTIVKGLSQELGYLSQKLAELEANQLNLSEAGREYVSTPSESHADSSERTQPKPSKVNRHSLELAEEFNFSSGLVGLYFEDKTLSSLATSRVDERIDFNWGHSAPDLVDNKDHFSIRWIGYLKVPKKGLYTFSLSSDDGIRVWIGNEIILDRWFDRSLTVDSASVQLDERIYPIKLEYYENLGGAMVSFRWQYETGEAKMISGEFLMHDSEQRSMAL